MIILRSKESKSTNRNRGASDPLSESLRNECGAPDRPVKNSEVRVACRVPGDPATVIKQLDELRRPTWLARRVFWVSHSGACRPSCKQIGLRGRDFQNSGLYASTPATATLEEGALVGCWMCELPRMRRRFLTGARLCQLFRPCRGAQAARK